MLVHLRHCGLSHISFIGHTWIYIARGCCLNLILMPSFGYTGALALKAGYFRMKEW